MIFTGHMAVGSGIGLIVSKTTNNPNLGIGTAFLIGWLSHYITDFIPHGHLVKYSDWAKKPPLLYFDILGGFFLFSFLILLKFGISISTLLIFAGVGGAQLPDFLEGLIYEKYLPRLGLIKTENDFHISLHWHGKFDHGLVWDLKRDIWQVSLIVISFLAILFS